MKPPKYSHSDEAACVESLLRTLDFSAEKSKKAELLAADLVNNIRRKMQAASSVEAFIAHYDLSTPEGVMLMNIAEALLRIPDKQTRDLLIRDKLTRADWQEHLGKSQSGFVNLVTRGLALSTKVLKGRTAWSESLQRYGEPLIRKAVRQAVKIMANQFVIGRTMEEALKASQPAFKKGYLFSYDMLGEVARTQADADRYFQAYQQAIAKLPRDVKFSAGVPAKGNSPIAMGDRKGENRDSSPSFRAIGFADAQDIDRKPWTLYSAGMAEFSGISIKLSALYPRYTFSHRELAVPALTAKLHQLALQAREANIGLTVDAEEADRLNMSLDIFAAVFTHPDFQNWDGLGMAVQAYQKRALPLIDWLTALARRQGKRINARLVKGAYWDSEIKFAQLGGFSEYPVFTRKSSTDLSYLTCAQRMLSAQDAIYPQFATHNAYSVAAILTMMENAGSYDFEFQSLQGMGRALHDQLIERGIACRIYAPVGSHEDLLPYLVRRLLENGANSSFVNQLANPKIPINKLISNPVERIKSFDSISNPKIPLPKNIFGPGRLNSAGIDLSDEQEYQKLQNSMQPFLNHLWQATPLLQPMNHRLAELLLNPADHRQVVGHVLSATKTDVEQALQNAVQAFPLWNQRTVRQRVDSLLHAAELLEKNRGELVSLASREAGKTLAAGIAEVREAVDFCRYYSQIALKTMTPREQNGATGESNALRLSGRGPLACISPWNFPIAIFTGQIVAALVTGNVVIAKPAEQTPLAAERIVRLFHEAGIPQSVLQLLPGTGETVGAALTGRPPYPGGIIYRFDRNCQAD